MRIYTGIPTINDLCEVTETIIDILHVLLLGTEPQFFE